MTDDKRDIQQLAQSLDEIKQLEAKLTSLKRHLVESASTVMHELMEGGDSTSFLIALVLERRFAVPVSGIEEVVEMVSPVTLTNPLPGVLGLINYHGDFIALFDLAEIAGLGSNAVSSDKVVIICTMGDKRFAVMIDEATDVVTVPKDQIRIADEVLSGVMREIAVVQTGTDTAAVVDLWSAVLALPLRLDGAPALSAAEMDLLGGSDET